jgi:hypothetical protein
MRNYHLERDKWKYIFHPEVIVQKKNFTLQELFERSKPRYAQPISKLPEPKKK